MGQHFKIGIISKLASKFLPDDAFFRDHIWYSEACALETLGMVVVVFS